MAYTINVTQVLEKEGLTISCDGTDAQEVSAAVQAAQAFLTTKVSPTPTPDPPQ